MKLLLLAALAAATACLPRDEQPVRVAVTSPYRQFQMTGTWSAWAFSDTANKVTCYVTASGAISCLHDLPTPAEKP